MTTNIFAAAPINTADADFRTWGSAVRAALTAVGLVRTSDTGQIDWTTVLKPAGTNTFQGYEIWRFNDTLQATAPIFLKIEYGSGPSSTVPTIRVQIGKGSNGAGTLTGAIGGTFLSGSVTASATVANWYVSSGDGSMLALVMAPSLAGSSPTTRGFLLVERSRDTSGAATGIGVVGMGAGTTGITCRNYASTAGANAPPQYWPAAIPADAVGATATLTAGGGSPMFQATVTDGAGNYWQPRCALSYLHPDCAALASVTIAGFGTYMPMDLGMNTFHGGGSSAVYGVGAIAWN